MTTRNAWNRKRSRPDSRQGTTMSTSSLLGIGRLGLLVGGGPAPGINGVLSAACLEARRRGTLVIGFQDGFRWLLQGDYTHWRFLESDHVLDHAWRGGSILGTSRANPTRSETSLDNVLRGLH